MRDKSREFAIAYKAPGVTCEWCTKPTVCVSCPEGAYHMHRECYPNAVAQGYFAKLPASKQEIPVECGMDTYHFVKGYRVT